MSYLSPSQFRGSLQHAVRGFRRALASEHSFRVHIVVAALIVILMLYLGIGRIETILIIFVMANILILELVNTVVERFVGLLEPRVHPYVRDIKDLMAAGVLILTVAAIFIGLLVFIPELLGVNT